VSDRIDLLVGRKFLEKPVKIGNVLVKKSAERILGVTAFPEPAEIGGDAEKTFFQVLTDKMKRGPRVHPAVNEKKRWIFRVAPREEAETEAMDRGGSDFHVFG